jgi:anti-anti-sigma regulatory factor
MTRTTHPLLPSRDRETPVGATAHSATPDLELRIRRDGRRPLVLVSGELGHAGKELLEAVLAHVRSTETGSIEVDLEEVTSADTHGLAPALRRDVVLVAVSPAVARLLRLMGVPLPRPRPRPQHGALGRMRRAPGPG